MRFRDRSDAGQRLANRLLHLRGEKVAVLGLPRGGVAVAAEIARVLDVPLDVILVRKLGVPVQPELGMGAIGEGGARVINPDVVRFARVSEEQIAAVEERERAELQRRAQRYRGDRPPVPLAGWTAIIVDDGIATGSTARAACQVARARGARRVVLAVPVAPRSAATAFAADADEVICLQTPERFQAIGEWYDDFSQTSDDEVIALLHQPASPAVGQGPWEGEVSIPAGGGSLPGHLRVPRPGTGIVVFAHGSGSSRASPRNQYVAQALNQAALGTLVFDLLSGEEERERANVFDIELLAGRLSGATRWLRAHPAAAGAPIGYFGASTGAAAALWAATEPGSEIAAVVSRGGRPDLAMPVLARVRCPTLLIVGGLDDQVLALNHWACDHLRCENQLAVVPGASHLFEEPGTLDQVAGLAREWFTRHLMPAHASTRLP